MRRTSLFALLASGHLVTTVALLVFVFGAGMSRFDTGGQPGWFETACGRVLGVLGFPVLTLVEGRLGRLFPGLWGYVPLIANSALWAAAVMGVLESVQWRRTRPRRTQTTRTR